MRKHDHSLPSLGISLLMCGVLAGLVVAAAAFPAVALAGLVAKATANGFENLPSILQEPKAPQITNLYASDGKTLITSLYDENRRNVPINQIAPVMLQAVVASEDKRFYDHNGVDIKGVVRALVNDQSGDAAQQGASTITMQYVRLSTLYSATTPQAVVDATADTPARKIREMHLAIALEQQLIDVHHGDVKAAKQDILVRYLNIAPFGYQTYGIYSASEVYFHVPPSKLKLEQAAYLAGLLQGASGYDPAVPEYAKAAIDRRNNHVLAEMLNTGMIDNATYQATIKLPLGANPKAQANGCVNTLQGAKLDNWGFFCDYLRRWWEQQPAFGSDVWTRDNSLETGGYNIITTMDVGDQHSSAVNIAKFAKPSDNEAMLLAGVEPGTGRVRFINTNRYYSNDNHANGPNKNPATIFKGKKGNYPNTVNPLMTGDGAPDYGYQFGSTWKMFTMLTALKQGIPLSYKIDAQKQYFSNFPMVDNEHHSDCDGYYCPKNASAGEACKCDMFSGFGRSVNTYFVPLEERVGVANVRATAQSLGLTFNQVDGGNNSLGALTLGVTSATPLQMASAYAAVAAGGKYCTPIPVQKITDANGNDLSVAQPQCKQALPANVANTALAAARCPVTSGYTNCSGSTAGGVANVVGHPTAGKTGTTDDNEAQSLIAMTPQLTVAGVTSDPDNPRGQIVHFDRPNINSVVAKTLRDAVAHMPVAQFAKPYDPLVRGTNASIPNVECMPIQAAASTLRSRGFRVTIMQHKIDSKCAIGQAAVSDPTGYTAKGAPVVIYGSNGKAPTPSGSPSGGPTPGTPGNRGGGNGGGNGGGTGTCVIPLFCPPGGKNH